MVKRCLGMVLFSWVVALSGADAAGLEIAVGGWQQEPDGIFGYQAVNSFDLIDIDTDLNWGTEIRVQGRAKIELPLVLPNVYLLAAPSKFEGGGRKAGSFTFGDQTFAGSVDFFSKLKFDQYDVGLYYGLPFLKTATGERLNVDLGFDARVFDVEAQIRQGAVGEKDSATAVIPLAYLGLQFAPIERLALEGEARLMSISGDSVYSLIGRVRVKLYGPLFGAGGYRYDKIDVDESDITADFELQGPFAEFGLKF